MDLQISQDFSLTPSKCQSLHDFGMASVPGTTVRKETEVSGGLSYAQRDLFPGSVTPVTIKEGDRKSCKKSKDGLNWGRGNGTEERTRRKTSSPQRWAP